jgi:hypothetical protein
MDGDVGEVENEQNEIANEVDVGHTEVASNEEDSEIE